MYRRLLRSITPFRDDDSSDPVFRGLLRTLEPSQQFSTTRTFRQPTYMLQVETYRSRRIPRGSLLAETLEEVFTLNRAVAGTFAKNSGFP